jgi:hypothetical protein
VVDVPAASPDGDVFAFVIEDQLVATLPAGPPLNATVVHDDGHLELALERPRSVPDFEGFWKQSSPWPGT